MLHALAQAWAPLTGEVLWKSLLLFVTAGAALAALPGAAAALRHRILLALILALLALPALVVAVPGWRALTIVRRSNTPASRRAARPSPVPAAAPGRLKGSVPVG